MRVLMLPLDWDRWPEVARLEKRMGKVTATHVYAKLWTELGYQAIYHPIGCLLKSDFEFFHVKVFPGERRAEDSTPYPGADELLKALMEAKVLADSGSYGGSLYYFCRTFLEANEEHLREHGASRAQLRHWERMQFQAKRSRFDKKASQDVGQIPDLHLMDVDDKRITPTERNAVVSTIRVIDSILGTKQRPVEDFGIGLMQDACRFYRRFGAEKIDLILQRFMARRKEPGLPRTAEQILANIDEFLIRIEPVQGWVEWSQLEKST